MMNETIKQQVYDVLDEYDKNYSHSSVDENLKSWESNKGWLLELLRHHSNWNEEALAVVFEVTHNREIDKATVNSHKYDLGNLIEEIRLPDCERNKFMKALNAVAFTYTKTLPGIETASLIKKYCGVSCSVGQKNSRIINAICKKYGLDKHPEYNARFAKLADALNPLQVKRTALLSVHPADFLEMSNRKNSWSSCHCLNNGEYHAGTLSYMNDACSIIFYTVDDSVSEMFHTAPKRTRQIFCYNDGILLQSRLYPQTDDEETREMYRNIVQRTIADCLKAPNLWNLKRDQKEVDQRITTHVDALHYRDYEYECYKANISLLKSANVDEDDSILVGDTAYCIDCSEPISENNTLYCDACNDDGYVSCNECYNRIHEDDAHFIEGNYYCNACCSYCTHCDGYTTGTTTEVQGRRGNSNEVCQSCLEENYYYCEGCDSYFHSDRGHHLADDFCCNDCLEADCCLCENCGEYVRNDDVEEIDDNYYCSSCAGDIKEQMEENREPVDYPATA